MSKEKRQIEKEDLIHLMFILKSRKQIRKELVVVLKKIEE